MPDITHQVNCNLQWKQRQTIYAKQGEYGARKIKLFLYNGSNNYDVPASGISAVFAYKRSDGFSDSYDTIDGTPAIVLNSTDDSATVTLAQQVLACAGTVECELQLLTANSLTATFTFHIVVEKSVLPGAEPSEHTTNPFIHSLADIGSGYAICGTAAATAAKVATINGYTLTTGGRVSIRFDNAVPANATLNISDTGAKDIYYHGSKVTGSLIGAGDLVTFVYDGSRYRVAAIDAAGSGGSVTPEAIVLATGDMTAQQAANTRENIGAGTYSKPGGGIPWGDLSSELMASIGKANTAAQPSDLLNLVPRGQQASKTSADTVEVRIDANGKLWVPPGGSTPSGDDNTTIITLTYYDGDDWASMTAAEIYAVLAQNEKNFVLIDRTGRQCALVAPPESASGTAKFVTYDAINVGLIVYTVAANGVTTSSTVSLSGFYTMPSGGIPSTDLAQAVQALLTAAGTALQPPTVQTVTGNTPTIAAAADNTVYDCTGSAITAVEVTSYSYGTAFSLIFNAQVGTAPTLTLDSKITMPDDFSVEANKHYEINVDFKGYATVQAWTLVD